MIVVLFSIKPREDADAEDEERTNERMWEIVSAMPGFLSYKRYVAEDGEAVSIVRFDSEEALNEWRTHPEHREAQRKGRESFYQEYWVQACQTIREYRFRRDGGYDHDLEGLFRQVPQP